MQNKSKINVDLKFHNKNHIKDVHNGFIENSLIKFKKKPNQSNSKDKSTKHIKQ